MATVAAHRRVASAAGDGRSRSEDVPAAVLLGRPALDVDDGRFAGYVEGATVLVTGAAGSVGSALSIRLAGSGAADLVVVDQSEAALVALAGTLEREHGFDRVTPVLADIRSPARVADVLVRHRPDAVFHAAAYKQVPLLEANPVEAVATNVLGTRSVVDAARRAGVERFVLFSTDKAVRPTSILGRTKAVAEWIVAAAGRSSPCERWGAVRLGNVADSAGSVLPLFRRQVACGGPVTVTHPAVERYLMTTDEAVGLAVVAGALGDSRSIFWLDLRPAVRVVEMVRRLAEAEARSVAIEFVGLRPGERLQEHLYWDEDEIDATPCDRVFRSPLPAVDARWLEGWVAALSELVEQASERGVRSALGELHAERARASLPATAGAAP